MSNNYTLKAMYFNIASDLEIHSYSVIFLLFIDTYIIISYIINSFIRRYVKIYCTTYPNFFTIGGKF